MRSSACSNNVKTCDPNFEYRPTSAFIRPVTRHDVTEPGRYGVSRAGLEAPSEAVDTGLAVVEDAAEGDGG
jgi:hypothetical protein